MGRIRLASLKLTGFKSFPDPVELRFPGQVTAVVGPNGAGKSNIVDAILWVLGEQSPTLLRLKQMGDLVFSGTATRRPAGAAEVVLTLAADDGRWEDTGGTLTLSRKVLRSGPSEYRINGRTARLKDMVDELAGIGLGTRAYAIIEQGRVGQVLSARPADRRSLIEEAAGITRYKVRRHEAELKLQQTRQNLLRLEDVVGEVDRSLRQLRRQARQAERYRRLEEELRRVLRRLRGHEARRLRQELEELRKTRARAENEVAAAAAALAGSDAELAAARRELEARRAEVEAAREEVARRLASCERAEAFLERSADLLQELGQARRRAAAEAGSAEERRSALAGQLEAARARLKELEAALDQVRGAAAEREREAGEARASLEEAETRLAAARREMLRAISELTETRNRLLDLEKERDRLAYTSGQLERERERLGKRRAETLERVETARREASQAAAHLAEVEERRAQLLRRREALGERLAEAGRETERLGHELWEARHRLSGLERDLARRSGPVSRLESLLPALEVVGQVSDFLEPDPEAAPLLDRAWREWLDLPVVEPGGLAELDAASLADVEERLALAVRMPARGAPPADAPAGVKDLTPRSGMAAGEAAWLGRVLPRVFEAPSLEVALQAAEAAPGAVVVTPDGTVVRGAAVELPTRGASLPGVLALREERGRLEEKITTVEARIEVLGAERSRVAGEHEKVTQEADAAGAELVRAEQARASTSAVEAAVVEEIFRLERELDAVQADIERTTRQREGCAARQADLERILADLEVRNRDLEAEVERLTSELAGLREAAAEKARAGDQARGEVRLAEERAATTRAEVERLRAEVERLDAHRRELEEQAEAAAKRIAATEAQVVATRTSLAEEQGQLVAAREQERRLAAAVEELAARVKKLEEEVRRRRGEHEGRRETLHRLQVEETRLEGEWHALAETVAGELGATLDELVKTEDAEDLDHAAMEALRADAARLREKVEKMGPVNLLALEEAGELEERSAFLHEQQKDLVESVRSLEATISEIDATCAERFVATFEKVNQVYAETFTYLFGGGTARLELVDEENPLESGIDIVARPPGKRIQSVQLLSGGEKALAALALLVALFRIKPSPFCILDEVDAPLDDANVERLADLVRDMTDHTQFLLITHNRRTMTRADVLYGVTMEEAGVSKVVSVRLEEMV